MIKPGDIKSYANDTSLIDNDTKVENNKRQKINKQTKKNTFEDWEDWYLAKNFCTNQADLANQWPGKVASYILGVQPSILFADQNKNKNEEKGRAARDSAAKAHGLGENHSDLGKVIQNPDRQHS